MLQNTNIVQVSYRLLCFIVLLICFVLFLELDSVHPYSLNGAAGTFCLIFFFVPQKKVCPVGLKTMAKNLTITARFETIVQDFKSLTFAASHFYSNKTVHFSHGSGFVGVCVNVCI